MGPEGSDTHVTTRVMGTYGYAAPEYVSTGFTSITSFLTQKKKKNLFQIPFSIFNFQIKYI